jgi:hypothetical protein
MRQHPGHSGGSQASQAGFQAAGRTAEEAAELVRVAVRLAAGARRRHLADDLGMGRPPQRLRLRLPAMVPGPVAASDAATTAATSAAPPLPRPLIGACSVGASARVGVRSGVISGLLHACCEASGWSLSPLVGW